ncbi:hypothetical protein A3D77_05345 [Candidatus Gottesmanbacteria bacterium RIFCSPHIGHO2_02_FULL_39_11]|uniref:Uncharacterized protein n=1 Tax=Candidatus Gottesmanbacteria bacterium RIFCSPHIGHO2_02_FULL_39_11 TaxID=1798382 RepID=A0A1F5ZLB2_9BACT|nr:MAG: hypothetical protein A3D77_05345 [Candidatus Gottesmanbacteria bacterium RIFCSPHIGHO2_02_FULL_39_11]
MSASKILTILFVILLVVTIFEVGYYLSQQAQKPQLTGTSPTDTVSEENQVFPTAIPTPAEVEEDDRRKMTKYGVLKSSVNLDTFEGILASIDLNGKVVEYNYEYRVKLGLKVGNDVIPIYLSKNAESVIKVKQSAGSVTTPITLEDLKVGDHIILERKLDTLSGDPKINVIDAQITRLND